MAKHLPMEHTIPHDVLEAMTPEDLLEIERMIKQYKQEHPQAVFYQEYGEEGVTIRWSNTPSISVPTS